MVAGDGATSEFDSNVRRELFFCTHHAIHHNAFIKVLTLEMGIEEVCPAEMGLAPSTISFMNSSDGNM